MPSLRAPIGTTTRRKRGKNVIVSIRTISLGLGLFFVLYLHFLWFASKEIRHPKATRNIDEGGTSNNLKVTPGGSNRNRGVHSNRKGRHAWLSSNTSTRATIERPKSQIESMVKAVRLKKATTKAHELPRENYQGDDVVTIGFASTVTGCGEEPFTEGAAVLKHAIHRTSIHGTMGGRYDYKMYVIYHPSAFECTSPLADLGFELIKRDTPVNVSDIRGEVLRERIVSNGCCGEKELIKLEAFTLTQHPIIVLLDLDVLVLQPMDAVFDLMLSEEPNPDSSRVPLMWPNRPLPRPVKTFWTKDYNVVMPGRKDKPTQGGLLILRPDMDVYFEFVKIVLEGDYNLKRGWGGKIGPFYGGMTIQGLLPYYYEYLHNDTGGGVELNRCVYNNMADNPTTERTIKDKPQGKCRTGQEICDDCRAQPLEDIVTFHFTICQKPWRCLPQKQDIIQMRLCRRLIHEWFLLRSDLEQSWGRNRTGPGVYDPDHFLGYCNATGFQDGYQKIRLPYGKP